MSEPPPNRDAILTDIRRYTEAGKTREETAAILGISKNSVIGLIQRHAPDLVVAERKKGAKRPPYAPTPPKKKHFRFDPQGGDRSMSGGMGSAIKRHAEAVAAYVPPPAEPPTPTMCTLLELEPMACRWPLDDGPVFHFCGAKQWRGPYCHHHYGRAYTQRNPDTGRAELDRT